MAPLLYSAAGSAHNTYGSPDDMMRSPEDEAKARIAERGRITFADFMELALYHPLGGYYARADSADASGDYYTSPTAHPAFGALTAVQLGRMWELLDRPSPFYAVEMGAGSGLLSRDVVAYADRALGPFAEALCYVTVDRARPPKTASQAQHVVAAGAPLRRLVGCLLSNELLDAFPVHRFEVRDGRVLEVYVAVRDGELAEAVDEPSTPRLSQHVEGLGIDLPEGFRGEVNLGIGEWMAGLAEALDRGFVLTIDYGYAREELYSPERRGGTVQGYYRHTEVADPYRRVGEQDITAHVDFNHVAAAGRSAGLVPLGIWSQAGFLRGLGLGNWIERLRREKMPEDRRYANLMGMRDLIRPEGLGGFKVLLQEKGTGLAELPDTPGPAAADLPLPLLGPEHMPLMEGRYPHLARDVDELPVTR